MIYDWLTEFTGSEIIAAFIQGWLPLLFFILPFVLVAVLAERKVSAHMQDRLGPMRVGYHGILQTIADLIKLLQKEDIIASANDKKLFNFAPVLVFVGSYAAFAAIPFSGAFIGSQIELGLLYIVAVTGLVVAGILMAGWASNNKYSLLGAMRAAAQIISYEIPTLLIILTVIMITGTLLLELDDIWRTRIRFTEIFAYSINDDGISCNFYQYACRSKQDTIRHPGSRIRACIRFSH
jgi:NADH-quinone oxidoreductase subunit H